MNKGAAPSCFFGKTPFVIAGVISSLSGLIVLAGWHLGNMDWVQLHPKCAPMMYNTALCFIFSGIGFTSLAFRKSSLSISCAIFAGGMGLATLAEYIFSIDLGIDQFFMTHSVSALPAYPGRMVLTTAISFIVTAIAIVLLNKSADPSGYRTTFLGLIGSLMAAFSVMAICGYFNGLLTMESSTNLTRMAAQTTALFIVLAFPILAIAWREGSSGDPFIPPWLPISFAFLGIAVSFSYWMLLRAFHVRTAGFARETLESSGAQTWIPEITLAAGILFSLLFAFLIFLLRRMRMRTIELEDANERLNAEITTRRRMNDSLRESEQKIKSILDHSPAVIYVKDVQGRFILINRRFEKMFRVTNSQIQGLTDCDLFPKDIADALRGNDRKVIETRSAVESEEAVPHGGAMHVYYSVKFPLFDSNGSLKAVCGISTDITERKRMEGQLQVAQKMEAIGRVAGGVAHDFNNLLTGIMGYIYLIKNSLPAGHGSRDDLLEMEKIAETAQNLTTHILAFSRRQTVHPEILNLNEIIQDSLKMIRRIIGDHVRIDTRLSPDAGVVKVDRGQFIQVLMNLAVNARDAMPDGGQIVIETTDHRPDNPLCRHPESGIGSGEFVTMTVRDTGIGIPGEIMSRIFEPFFTTKELGKGTGLGLATCYGIVRQNGGHISVESVPGKGSAFKICLPRLPDLAPIQEVSTPDAPASGAAMETLLIVEDNENVRTVTSRFLRDLGYTVFEADCPLKALEIEHACREKIHLLLTDVMMPALNGIQLARKIAARRPGIRTIYISGYMDGEAPSIGLRDSAAYFLKKPFALDRLSRMIRALLDKIEVPSAGTSQ